ncbi:tripartite tricarboxylate transporter substrate binding protein [Nocardiopsis coralliicola]
MKCLRSAAVVGAALILTTSCSEASEPPEEYPSRAVEYVVPFAPGGATDIAARAAADALSAEIGVPVNIVNQPGADQIIGVDNVRRADPDGYTLLADGAGSSSIQGLLPYVPYDWKDRTFIARIASGPHAYVVGGNSEYQDLGDALDAAREVPENFTVGWIGGSSTSDFATVQLLTAHDIDVTKVRRVPFESSGDVMRAVAAGDIDFGAGGASSTFTLQESGELRAVAVTGDERMEELPDAPTTAELDLPEVDMPYWVGVSGPAGMDDNLANVIADLVTVLAEQDAFAGQLESVGMEPDVVTGKELRDAVAEESDEFSGLYDEIRLSDE